MPGANSWEPPGPPASLLSGRKIDSSLKIAHLFADNTMQAKYLETKSHTRSAGSRQALLREAAGRAKVVIIHRALFAVSHRYCCYERILHIDKTIVKRYIWSLKRWALRNARGLRKAAELAGGTPALSLNSRVNQPSLGR